MNASLVNVLMLEDVQADVELAQDELESAGLAITLRHVRNEAEFRTALLSELPDIILADFTLPQYDGHSALLLRRQLAPETPFIFVTGSLGEERAVETLRVGATDFVLKQNLPRLPLVVLRALAESNAMRDQRRIQRELDHERHLLTAVLSTTGALIVVLDHVGCITRLNPAAESAIGYPQESMRGMACWDVLATAEERESLRHRFDNLSTGGRDGAIGQSPWRSTLGGKRTILWSAGLLKRLGSTSEYAVLAGIDVTDQEEAEQQAYLLRHYDGVTGLPNRELLLHRLLQDPPLDGHEMLALILVGIERLAEVRDSLGVATSNLLLKEASRRLQSWQQAGDWLAKVGETTFALVTTIDGEGELPGQLQRMLEQLRQPYRLEHREFFLPAYLGATVHSGSNDPNLSLQAAEAALHKAVDDQGVGYRLYQPMLSDEARERLLLEGQLHEALQGEGQLELYYQPQVSLETGRIMSVEALVRWRHPTRGLLLPAQFIPLAEATGLIIALGERVLHLGCLQAAAWQRSGLGPITVAINLASAQWGRPLALVETVRAALEASGIEPQWLELELTESTSMHAPSTTIEVMELLRKMGVHLSIDDFGTGYCNLSYLKRFPVDKLKIDRSFVSDIITDPDDLAISRTVIAMGHQLGLEVVAEGVETEGQLALLTDAGCDLIQGFYFSRPVTAQACGELIGSRATLTSKRRDRGERTLLLLDDEPQVLTALRRVFRSSGCRLLSTTSPNEAFELLATHEVGVIISDQRMAELSGTEFLNRVKVMYPETVRMILSGYTDLKTVTEAVNQGAIYKFLTKPWNDEELTATVTEAFAKYEQDRGRHS
ncbi:MAG: EAL domain-containing protein [Burkholderiales bacterium]|nr:EAL domain-containing protein [Burkholderiales bacterium]